MLRWANSPDARKGFQSFGDQGLVLPVPVPYKTECARQLYPIDNFQTGFLALSHGQRIPGEAEAHSGPNQVQHAGLLIDLSHATGHLAHGIQSAFE